MEGQEFLTINPGTLNDSNIWSYRDLQKICKALSIKANEKRSVLIENLQTWHRLRKDGTKTLVEDFESDSIEMNVVGSNFSILAVNVKPKRSNINSKRKSIVGIGDETGVVSPTLLRPLRSEPATPGKSCMKQSCFTSSQDTDIKVPTPKRLPNISFSPFNGVRVIAHRDKLVSMEDEERIVKDKKLLSFLTANSL
jgi:hypothetical protein